MRSIGRGIVLFFTLFVVALLILPTIMPKAEAISLLKPKRTIRVAFLWQRWDFLDKFASKGMLLYKYHLRQAERKYNVKFKVFSFWDNRISGDVQDGLLTKMNIDVAIGPGGVGGFNSPEKYRQEIKKFVRRGSGFYGICGDSTFGSLGLINLPKGTRLIMQKNLGFKDFTPTLGLANVYSDASSLKNIFRNPYFFSKIHIWIALIKLTVSRVPIKILHSVFPIQKPYFGERVNVMMGNVPLVDGPKINRLFMGKVSDIAIFKSGDDPYDHSFRNKKAIVATNYFLGRVVLSAPHPELTVGNSKAHDIFSRNILWCARELPVL